MRLSWILAFACLFGLVVAPAQAETPATQTIEFFSAMKSGQIEVKYIRWMNLAKPNC